MQIISQDAYLLKKKDSIETKKLPYVFKGTLLEFTISTDSFEEEEIINEFNW